MAISIKNIAEEAGVSIATVSLVINDCPGISDKTRLHVKEIIEKYNYVPNARARSISKGKTGVVALITPPWKAAFSDPYYTEMIRGALEAAREHEYQLMLEISDNHFLKNKLWKTLFDSKKIDGLLIATPYLDQDYLKDLYKLNEPVLLLNGERPDLPSFKSYCYDDFQCGMDATNYLLQLGHSKIAHIAGPLNQTSAQKRLEGYKEALKRANLPVLPEYIGYGQYMPLEARDAASQILKLPESIRPSAFFCANDTMGASVIRYLTEQGYSIPNQFSIVGVDDNIIAQSVSPQLTTFKQDIHAISFLGTSNFIKHITQNDSLSENSKRIPMELIIRKSCTRYQNKN